MISYILPTRNRPERLKQTLLAINSMGDHSQCGGAEIIVVDNDSEERSILPKRLSSGIQVSQIRLKENIGAAARNVGAAAADTASTWLVMLDDDSYPDDIEFLSTLDQTPADVGAVSADIYLPLRPTHPAPLSTYPHPHNHHHDHDLSPARAPRESGGLPEVFIGCGVAIRRELFLRLGGYDPSFGYYAEEYDLAAKILHEGYRVLFDHHFTVQHDKDAANRDFNLIVSRLIRNNGWVAQRFAPEPYRLQTIRETRTRYRRIAETEHATEGYAQGLLELRRTIRKQTRRPLPTSLWDRFTGLHAARTTLGQAFSRQRFSTASIVDHGKNAWAVAQALQELGVRIIHDGEEAEAIVIGTLSPGPLLDAYERRLRLRRPHGPRLLAPWLPARTSSPKSATLAA